jgi:hypothetical protein
MNSLVRWLIGWPERVAQHLQWVAPPFARVVVGWVFMEEMTQEECGAAKAKQK